MRQRFLIYTWLLIAIVVGLTNQAHAVSITLNGDPSTVVTNDNFSVDLNISGLGAGISPSLGAYDINVLFAGILGLDSVDFGTGLGFSFPDQQTIVGGVNLAETSLDPAATLNANQNAAFTLATLNFTASGDGATGLAFNITDLSDENGNSLSVTAVSSVGTPLLICSGLLGWHLGRQQMLSTHRP